MPGDFSTHLDRFGMCTCGNPSGETEMMSLESEVAPGRHQVSREPACADCYGLL